MNHTTIALGIPLRFRSSWKCSSLTVATREDLLSLERKIETSSHVVYALSEADLAPGEAYGLVTTDPDGRQIRLVVPTRPDRPCEAVADSLAPQNIGHVVLWTPDSSVSEAFYGLLGFSVTDRTHLGMSFLKCGNEDHHSLALVGSKTGRVPGGGVGTVNPRQDRDRVRVRQPELAG